VTRFARHLQQHSIQNPFQGMVRLERELGHPLGVRLGSNESPPLLNPALQAFLGPLAADLARLYPDPYAHALRGLVAELNQVADSQVIFDSGADSLILLALRLFCDVGDNVVCSAGSYPAFRYFADGCGVRVLEVSLQDIAQRGMQADLGALACAAHQHQARLVYLANPDNPTGHYHAQSEIERLRHSLPPDCILLLDEAYLEFTTTSEPVRSPVLPNTLRLRTLSKAYALAGLRVGYAIADTEIITKADEIRTQFSLSSFAQAAAAIVLQAQSDVIQLTKATIKIREEFSARLIQRGLRVLPSWTNFVSIRYADSGRAEAVQRQLFNQGIAVHRPLHSAVSQLLRVTAQPLALSDTIIDTLAG
jgi:histidinol-phosphate aminotransferase